MNIVRRNAATALSVAFLLAACGGGGGGGDGTGGASASRQTLQVSVTFPRQTLSLFQPAQVQPALSGFEGHTPACTLVSGQIPPGMLLNGNCTIAGTPTVQGTYGFTLRVSAADVANTLDFAGTIGVQGPGIQYQLSSIDRPRGAAISSAPTLSWWPAPIPGAQWNYVVVSGALAPGLALDPTTGVISGTLTTPGSFTAQIAASLTTPAGHYQTDSTAYSVAVNVPTFSYPSLAITNSVGDSVLYVGLGAGLQPRTDPSNTLSDFVLAGGVLPAGLALDPATGIISGFPTSVSSSASIDVEATVTTMGVGNRVRANTKLEIRVPGRLEYPSGNSVPANATFNSIRPFWMPDPDIFLPANVTATLTPKSGSCTLPAGVTSDLNGSIDGHPTQTGSFQCTFVVTYSANGVQWLGEAVLNLDVQ